MSKVFPRLPFPPFPKCHVSVLFFLKPLIWGPFLSEIFLFFPFVRTCAYTWFVFAPQFAVCLVVLAVCVAAHAVSVEAEVEAEFESGVCT